MYAGISAPMTLGAEKLEGTERKSCSSQCHLLYTSTATDCFWQQRGWDGGGRKLRVRSTVDTEHCGQPAVLAGQGLDFHPMCGLLGWKAKSQRGRDKSVAHSAQQPPQHSLSSCAEQS